MKLCVLLCFATTVSAYKVCQTPDCRSVAKSLLALLVLNGTADPCTDFYSFACGKRTPQNVNAFESGLQSSVIGYASGKILDKMGAAFRQLSNRARTGSTAIASARLLYEQCRQYSAPEPQNENDVFSYVLNFANWPLF